MTNILIFIILIFLGFLKSIAKLFCQIDYILLVLVISVECILAAGFTSFMVTFTQNQFQVDPSKSSILTGGVVVPSAIVGKKSNK